VQIAPAIQDADRLVFTVATKYTTYTDYSGSLEFGGFGAI